MIPAGVSHCTDKQGSYADDNKALLFLFVSWGLHVRVLKLGRATVYLGAYQQQGDESRSQQEGGLDPERSAKGKGAYDACGYGRANNGGNAGACGAYAESEGLMAFENTLESD